MIKSFRDANTASLFETGKNKRWSNIARVAYRKLDQIDNAQQLSDLKVPPGNHLEALVGDREGQHCIRINDQYRICFVWNDGAHDVELVDYH